LTGKKPTIRDVAKEAGVSGATVSYILNGRGNQRSRISPETKARVLAAAHQLGYTANAAARNLRRQRTDRICLVTPTLSPYNSLFIHRLQEAADAKGYFTVSAVAGTEQRERQIFNELRRGFVDGAVLIGTQFLDGDHFRQLAEGGLALVVGREEVEPDGFDVINNNEAGASAEAVAYLVQQGHRQIAVFGNLSNILQVQKVNRYLALLAEQGIQVDARHLRGDVLGRRVAYDLVRTIPTWVLPPTAILATSDRAAIGCILGARDAGIRVPEELAIIGFGNIPETEITTPPLSTIGQPVIDFRPYIDLLFSRLAAEKPVAGRVATTQQTLIHRGSA